MFNTEPHAQYTIAFDTPWLITGREVKMLRHGNKAKLEAEQAYLDYFNNYLTIERFASDYRLSVDNATLLINQGRKLNHARGIA
jgi:hypothetical protein